MISQSGNPAVVSGRALWADRVHVRAEETGGEELRAERGAKGLCPPLPRQRHHARDRGIRELRMGTPCTCTCTDMYMYLGYVYTFN